MARFAEGEELALFLDIAFTSDQIQRAEFLLQLASAAIRIYTGQQFELVTDDEVQLTGTFDDFLLLPQRPVVDVASVAIQYPGQIGTFLPGAAFSWDRRGRLYYGASAIANGPDPEDVEGSYGGPNSTVTVVYTHGENPVPDGVILATLMIAGRLFTSPAFPAGLESETIGDYSYVNRKAREIAISLIREERQLLDPYCDLVGTLNT